MDGTTRLAIRLHGNLHEQALHRSSPRVAQGCQLIRGHGGVGDSDRGGLVLCICCHRKCVITSEHLGSADTAYGLNVDQAPGC